MPATFAVGERVVLTQCQVCAQLARLRAPCRRRVPVARGPCSPELLLCKCNGEQAQHCRQQTSRLPRLPMNNPTTTLAQPRRQRTVTSRPPEARARKVTSFPASAGFDAAPGGVPPADALSLLPVSLPLRPLTPPPPAPLLLLPLSPAPLFAVPRSLLLNDSTLLMAPTAASSAAYSGPGLLPAWQMMCRCCPCRHCSRWRTARCRRAVDQ